MFFYHLISSNVTSFKTREYTFTLKNVGTVNLDFFWDLRLDESYPIRLDQEKWKSASNVEASTLKRERGNEQNILIDEISEPNLMQSSKKLQIKSQGNIFQINAGVNSF